MNARRNPRIPGAAAAVAGPVATAVLHSHISTVNSFAVQLDTTYYTLLTTSAAKAPNLVDTLLTAHSNVTGHR